MTSTFRLLLAAMPDIAAACERIDDPALRDKAFDVLVQAARDGGDLPVARWDVTAPTGDVGAYSMTATNSGYDPTSTRIDNGMR